MCAGNTLKAAYAHNIDAFQSVGGEITKPLNNDSDVSIALGYSRRLVDGALAKAKLQNNGTVSLLYQTVSTPTSICVKNAVCFVLLKHLSLHGDQCRLLPCHVDAICSVLCWYTCTAHVAVPCCGAGSGIKAFQVAVSVSLLLECLHKSAQITQHIATIFTGMACFLSCRS